MDTDHDHDDAEEDARKDKTHWKVPRCRPGVLLAEEPTFSKESDKPFPNLVPSTENIAARGSYCGLLLGRRPIMRHDLFDLPPLPKYEARSH